MVIVNRIRGIEKESNGHRPVNKLKIFSEDREETMVARMVTDFLSDDKKFNREIYNTYDIEEDNRQLLNAVLYSNGIEANKFEGTLEIFELK